MTMDEIKALNIELLADENCAMFLWCTFPYLDEQIKLFKHWGFKYRTVGFTWIKTNPKNGKPFFGVGITLKATPKFVYWVLKEKLKPISNKISSIVIAPRREHSRKPDEVKENIVKIIRRPPRIELFARQATPGWGCLGKRN